MSEHKALQVCLACGCNNSGGKRRGEGPLCLVDRGN